MFPHGFAAGQWRGWQSRNTVCLHYNNIFSKVMSLVASLDCPRKARPAVCPGRGAPIYKTLNYLNLQDTINICQCLRPLPSSGPCRQTLAGLFSLGSPLLQSSCNTPVFSFSPSWPPSPLCDGYITHKRGHSSDHTDL